jgi:hypothetical protein
MHLHILDKVFMASLSDFLPSLSGLFSMDNFIMSFYADILVNNTLIKNVKTYLVRIFLRRFYT